MEKLNTPQSRAAGSDCMWGGAYPMQRLQFDLPEEKLRELEIIREETGLTTIKDLMSNAVALFLWAVREVKKGRSIASVDEVSGRYKEVWMPALENVAKRVPIASDH